MLTLIQEVMMLTPDQLKRAERYRQTYGGPLCHDEREPGYKPPELPEPKTVTEEPPPKADNKAP